MKNLPLVIATAVVVAAQLAGTYLIASRVSAPRQPDEIFVDHIGQLVYDGQVIRANLGRAWINENGDQPQPQTETRVVGRLVLTKDATLQLHRHLAELLAVAREPGIGL